MQIEKDKIVTLNYTLKNDDGVVVDNSDDGSFMYLHGAKNIIPGLESALEGKSSGDAITVSVSPEQGYGVRDESRVQPISRQRFDQDDEIEVGMQFQAQGPDEQMFVVTVVSLDEENVVVDGNHPLAGVQLNFQVDVIDVRDASAVEISHGHPHGPGGHH
jgi:FKBP-type peptidyl-prolyl cis-trans isomerase SlyD